MNLRRTLFLLVALLGCAAAQNIPHVDAETLAGGKISLPSAALGHPAIFTIGFSRAGGNCTSAWNRELKKDLAGNPDLHFYTVAVLQDAPKMVRGMIKHGMRSGVPKDEQNAFILIYEAEDAWKSFAGFSDPNIAYVVLVDPSGASRVKVHGKAPDDQSIGTLKSELTQSQR